MTVQLDQLVHEYLDAYHQPREKSWKEKVCEYTPKYNPEFNDLKRKMKRSNNLVEMIKSQLVSKRNCDTVISIARAYNQSYQSGLAIGYIFPNENFKIDNTNFGKGLKTGQIYALKTMGCARSIIFRGLFLSLLGYGAFKYDSPYGFTPENLSLDNFIGELSSKVAIVSSAYGIYAMLRHGLLGSDAQLSKELVTSGQFRLHRNPFYTGMLTTHGFGSLGLLTTATLSENSSWLAAGLLAAGFAITLKGCIDYTKQDEKVLEKQFGDEYREYKKSTPRFFPKISNLWRGEK